MIADEVVERFFSEFGERGQWRRTYDTLQVGVNAVTLAWDLVGRAGVVPADAIIECEYELALNSSTDPATFALTLAERGYAESAAAEHIAGRRVYIGPEFTRISVLNALKGILGSLKPWGVPRRVVDSSLTVPAVAMVTLPTAAKQVRAVLVETMPGQQWIRLIEGKEWELYPEFSPMKLRVSGGIPGRPVQLVYYADYDLSTFSKDTDLTALGVPETLQEHLPLAIAGRVLVGHEVPKLLEAELRALVAGVPQVQVGSDIQVAQALTGAFRATAVADEIRRLQELDPPRARYVGMR